MPPALFRYFAAFFASLMGRHYSTLSPRRLPFFLRWHNVHVRVTSTPFDRRLFSSFRGDA